MQNAPTHRYRHYKDGEYKWLCGAAYRPDPTIKTTVYHAANDTAWTRPSMMFHEVAEIDSQEVPRFVLTDWMSAETILL